MNLALGRSFKFKSIASDNQVTINNHTDSSHSKSDKDDIPVSSMMNSVPTYM